MAASLRPCLTVVLLSALGMAHGAGTSPLDGGPVAAAEDDPGPSKAAWHGRLQLRRENVDRGTSEETTKTYLRSDNFVWGGMLSFQVAFPDEKTDFGGSPFNPRLGDSKVRFRFAPLAAGRFDMSYFIEAAFPTADPEDLGSGKCQLSAGVTASTAIAAPQAMSGIARAQVHVGAASIAAGASGSWGAACSGARE